MEGDTADGLQVQPGGGTALNVCGILWISSLMCVCGRARWGKRGLERGGADPEGDWAKRPSIMFQQTSQTSASQHIIFSPFLL